MSERARKTNLFQDATIEGTPFPEEPTALVFFVVIRTYGYRDPRKTAIRRALHRLFHATKGSGEKTVAEPVSVFSVEVTLRHDHVCRFHLEAMKP